MPCPRLSDILATTRAAGLIQAVPNTVSIDSLKKKDLEFTTLADFFERRWGVLGDNTLEVRILPPRGLDAIKSDSLPCSPGVSVPTPTPSVLDGLCNHVVCVGRCSLRPCAGEKEELRAIAGGVLHH